MGGGLLPRPGALLRPGGDRLPAFVGGGMLRHAWDSVRPGRWYEAGNRPADPAGHGTTATAAAPGFPGATGRLRGR
ncbi:hypothetical protein SSP531S_18230 [Streptomyces spongiicola]|uniref:Uncharacterized protein n=1 Tax=Streptomyces spongiicola TaxID=1690221 RepID=A0A388SUU3_9ACTN|nr:hypothetical protein SSP531S_18230 [Streptomyces spongiicola]